MCLAEDLRCFGIATATEASAEQIAYATPVSSVLDWFRNHWVKGTCIGRFPRWGFSLCPRTDAFDDEYSFPRDLDGAVITSVKKSDPASGIQPGDVLIGIHRAGTTVGVGKFGMVSDFAHGQPRFSIHNFGFLCSLPKTTTVTVWRPSTKNKRTFVCPPQPPATTERSYYQAYDDPPYTCLGSLVLMNASPDLLRASETVDSDDESDGLPAVQTFHILRHVQQQKTVAKPKHVVVLTHMHPNAYVSSTRTLVQGDIITKINGVALRDTQHAEKLVRKAAAEYFSKGKRRILLSTPNKRVYFDLQKLLQEETLCLAEREHTKLHLLLECTKSAHKQTAESQSTSRTPKRKRRSARVRKKRETLSITTVKMQELSSLLSMRSAVNSAVNSGSTAGSPASRQSSRPGSPVRKRRRSSRLLARA